MIFNLILFQLSVYFFFNFCLILIWISKPKFKNKGYFDNFTSENSTNKTRISVIIPVRNEAKNIDYLLSDLEKQTLSKNLFEVIIADDDSDDETLRIVKDFKDKCSFSLIINQLPNKSDNFSPKKRAIESSIKLASGEIITTTDGDCRVGENWLQEILDFQEETNAFLISGAVSFYESSNNKVLGRILGKMQIIEFASLVGSGACSMLIAKPNMCNGANLSYLKSAFYEVGGFNGNENLASGDDEFLMHKIAKKYPDKVQFLKSQKAIVETQAHNSWRSFYYQRKRWASKWKHYENRQISALAVFIFLSNFSWLLACTFFGFCIFSMSQFITLIFLKFGGEFIFLSLFLVFLQKKKLIFLIPLVQIIYPFYVVFFGFAVQGSENYIWKGRELK